MPNVTFTFHTGLNERWFSNVQLAGSWDSTGRPSTNWTRQSMVEVVQADGTLSYEAMVALEPVGASFSWGLEVDAPARDGSLRAAQWAIASEEKDWQSCRRERSFTLGANPGPEQYYLTRLSQLGANIQRRASPGLVRFAVWAPNARSVQLVFGDPVTGYIGDDGHGAVQRHAMQKAADNVWQVEVGGLDVDKCIYMFQIVNLEGSTVYRTDLYSRCQVGSGDVDPGGGPTAVTAVQLDGRVSCSFIMDTTKVEHPINSGIFVDAEAFWADEFDPERPVPRKATDLVIYELHVGALGFGKTRPGDLHDAIALVDYLVALGVNAVELLPISEFSGTGGWGYGTTHFCAVEFSSGGPDHLKAFVKACHQRGIAVILDVVYNHYPDKAERAQWRYDSSAPERNIYYWYEGDSSRYTYKDGPQQGQPFPDGGYIDNISSGWAPAFHEEMVRGLFISSAAQYLTQFHIDGFRVDQTTSIHAYPTLHWDGSPADQARIFGAKFLRELGRTLRLLREDVVLIAEDHSDWDQVLKPVGDGGMGFSAKWYNDFYHHLIGDTGRSPNLLSSAGFGGNWPLGMTAFASILERLGRWSVVFHESHDEAGNSKYDDGRQSSRRTLLAAVNESEPSRVVGSLRGYAEARPRVVAGLSMLSAGIPMFLMGEEVGAAKPYRFDDWFLFREDLWGERRDRGARLFRFYQDLIALRARLPALRSSNTKIVHAHDDNRVIAFKRWSEHSEALILVTLSNEPYAAGYVLRHDHIPGASWREVFSSDASAYGGLNFGNSGRTLTSVPGTFEAIIPPNGFVVFERQ